MKTKIYNLLMLLGLLGCMTACDKDELVFDHELPQFEIRQDAILLEVIMPQGTVATDEIYIVGDFNGGEEAALADPRWQLEKAQGNDIKWGIYLYPADFVEGKTLADGYYFVNKQQGTERTLKNEETLHYDNPSVGTRTNLTIVRWKSYFDTPINPDDIKHDGYVVYVLDNTSWDALALYAWGSDLPELFGGWPGAQPTGEVTKDGKKFKYFDCGEANNGLTYNLIFNNNGGGNQFDGPAFTLDHDLYLEITDDGWSAYDPLASITHDGYAIFIEDKTGWDALAMYGWWSDAPELFGGWPGAVPTGEVTINGVRYKYFDTGEANVGTSYNIIMNNNGGGKQFDLAGVTLDRDYYFTITAKSGEEVDPETYTGNNDPVIPEPDPEPGTMYTIYVDDQSGWDALAIYAWGDDQIFGNWPGVQPSGTIVVDGVTYTMFPMEGRGEKVSLIFNNNNGGIQFDGPGITADRDYWFRITDSSCTELNKAGKPRRVGRR